MVGNGLHRHEAHAVAKAYLRDGAAFLLRQNRTERIPDELRPLTVHGKPVACGHPTRNGVNPHVRQQLHAPLRLPCGELHPVYRGHKADGVADCGGVHIMLHEFRRHHKAPGRQIRQAARHARVQNKVHAVFQAENLRRHSGVHLADAPGAGDNVRLHPVKGNAGYRFKGLHVLCPRHGVKFRGHGKLQCDLHIVSSCRSIAPRSKCIFSRLSRWALTAFSYVCRRI